MKRALVAVIVFVAGCGGGTDERPRAVSEPFKQTTDRAIPSYLDQSYADGTISLRYPKGWIENRTRTFGRVVSDTTSFYAAFVGIRYLPSREWRTHGEFSGVAARALRPPDGEGIDVRYTQAARVGGRLGSEALVVWTVDSRPYAVMRLFGVELASGEVALITFATENHGQHAATFAWIKRSIAWK